MSTRYVWDKYSLKNEWLQETVEQVRQSGSFLYPQVTKGIKEVHDENTGDLLGVIPDGEYLPLNNKIINITQGWYVCFLVGGTWNNPSPGYCTDKQGEGGTDWSADSYAVTLRATQWNGNTPDYSKRAKFYFNSIVKSQGDYIGLASSSASNRYPTDSGGGAKDGAWFIYKGSDNIDPYSVNYSSDELEAGKNITVTLNPRSNTYGGTVYYQYSYSTNGGTSWTNYGGKTTSTSQNITVPSNATQFRVRVQTSDDMGFTSTDYVTGTNLEVSQMKAYVGEKGIARKVDKMYIGVNGVARQVIKGYVGVDGVARKFL